MSHNKQGSKAGRRERHLARQAALKERTLGFRGKSRYGTGRNLAGDVLDKYEAQA